MNTEEAIEFEKSRLCLSEETLKKQKDVIKLLQSGKKYKQMWEELEKNTTSEGLLSMNGEDFRSMREMIKEKYFPENEGGERRK